MDVRCDDRSYVRCGGTGVARLVRTRLAPSLVPTLLQPAILSYNCAQGEIVMRTPILTIAFVMGVAAAAFAMPLAPSAGSSNVVLVHGCHHYYAQDYQRLAST